MRRPCTTWGERFRACATPVQLRRFHFAHECARRRTGQNVLSVLVEGGTPEQALHRAVGLRDRVLCRFLELRDAVRARASAPLRRYVDDLAHGIRGNIEWAARTLRYSGGAARDAGPVRPRWTDAPLPGGRDPSGLPSIAWWWQVSG
ncbi:hypothetical protein [Streptomyces sp. NPDC013181]|uniref:hypothetical protein n=1 Tax=Streptomyces sp. NPDC013181 TaxID=3364864 RepID=UPI0036B0A69D